MEIDLRAHGFEESERALVQLSALLTDLRLFWPRLVPVFVEWMGEQFGTEGEWGGEHWAPLSDDYAKRKELTHPGKGILYATGDLLRAATTPRRIATPESLSLIVDDSAMRHGGSAPRSVVGFHQEGAGTMPARPIIPEVLPLAAQAQIHEVADEWLSEMVVRLGLNR